MDSPASFVLKADFDADAEARGSLSLLLPAFSPAGLVKCPDCPVARRQVLTELLPDAPTPCGLRRLSVDARAPIPFWLLANEAFALVRRGVIIRQRADVHGGVVSVDIAGPGAYLPLGSHAASSGSVPAGYAATDVLLCVYAETASNRQLACLATPTLLELQRLQLEALERVERIADARSRSTVARRVAALLCVLADTLSPPRSRCVIPALYLRDLAGLLDTRHESLCRELRKLEQQRLIERSPEHIRLVDREALEQF